MWTALFRTITAFSLLFPATALADDSFAAYGAKELLKGIQVVHYLVGIRPEKEAKNCTINYAELDTDVRFVAAQSSRLELIPNIEHSEKVSALYDKANTLLKSGGAADQFAAAERLAEQFNWSPALTISGEVIEIGGGCFVKIEAVLTATTAASKLLTNDAPTPRPEVTLWTASQWVFGPNEGFSKHVSGICEQLIKKLVNDWSALQ
jgi:hypothetical protein